MSVHINYGFIIFANTFFAVLGQHGTGRIILFHTNDIHSHLNGFSPELEYTPCDPGTDDTRGGLARIAAIIDEDRKKNPSDVLVVDAGDFLMGTLFHSLEIKTGFQLPLMKKAGYDILGLGNHEFDFGPDAFAKIVQKSLENGDIPKLCLSNIKFSKKEEGDKELKLLYKKGVIKRYHVIERGGLRIGIFALMGENADNVSPSKYPIEITNYIRTARRIVRTLRTEENVDLIICLSHSGLTKHPDGSFSGEDIALARRVNGIDIIVSGHSHHKLTEPLLVNETAIIQAGAYGKNVGRYEIYVNNGIITLTKYQLLKIDDRISGNCQIQEKIDEQIKLIDKYVLNDLGKDYYTTVAATSYDLYVPDSYDLNKSNLGPFVADAIHYYVNEHSQTSTDIAMIAAGVIRNDIKAGKTGMLIPADVFRVVSLGAGDDDVPGYPLAKVYLTARELKKLFEVLFIASEQSRANHCYYAGVEIIYDPAKGFLRKIQKIIINDEEIDLSRKNEQLYSLTANLYMLEFVGMIRKLTYGLVRLQPKDENGNDISNFKNARINFASDNSSFTEGKEWLAILKFIGTFKDKSGNGLRDFPELYSHPINRVIQIRN